MTQVGPVPNRDYTRWIAWAISGLAIAFLLMDATMKLLALPVVLEASAPLGFPGAEMARGLGTVLLICTILYAVPRTAVRVESPLFTHILFGVYLGMMLWGGLYLRDVRLRALFPLRVSA